MLEAHPLASAFPMIEGQAFDELVASIKEHGLMNPIVLLDGRILDGRNRYRACLKAGVDPTFYEYNEADPEKWRALVDAANIQRRHLTESQRAMIAAELRGMTSDGAARAVNVSQRSVIKARMVKRSGDAEVIDLVARGKISVHRAEQVLRKNVPRGVLGGGGEPKGGRKLGNAQLARFNKALDGLLALRLHAPAIIANWRGDPDAAAKITLALDFLKEIEDETRENDRATISA